MTWRDKIEHFVLMAAISFIFGWRIAVAVGLTIEGVQGERVGGPTFMGRVKSFMNHFTKEDTWLDLLADTIGILGGLYVRYKIGW